MGLNMKTLCMYFFGICLVGCLGMGCGYLFGIREAELYQKPVAVKAYFSPKGGCTEAIVSVLAEAKKTVYVQAYSFTSDPIGQALAECKRRGVSVKVVLDRSQYDAKGAVAFPLHESGIEVRMDARHPIAHNKVIIIDNQILITGSFNFTRQAETGNAENLLVVRDAEIASLYAENWSAHWAHSDVYHGEPKRPK